MLFFNIKNKYRHTDPYVTRGKLSCIIYVIFFLEGQRIRESKT